MYINYQPPCSAIVNDASRDFILPGRGSSSTLTPTLLKIGQFWTSFDVTWKLFRATVRMTLWAGAGFQPTAEGFPK